MAQNLNDRPTLLLLIQEEVFDPEFPVLFFGWLYVLSFLKSSIPLRLSVKGFQIEPSRARGIQLTFHRSSYVTFLTRLNSIHKTMWNGYVSYRTGASRYDFRIAPWTLNRWHICFELETNDKCILICPIIFNHSVSVTFEKEVNNVVTSLIRTERVWNDKIYECFWKLFPFSVSWGQEHHLCKLLMWLDKLWRRICDRRRYGSWISFPPNLHRLCSSIFWGLGLIDWNIASVEWWPLPYRDKPKEYFRPLE